MLKESTIHELLDILPLIKKRALQEEILEVATLAADEIENPDSKPVAPKEDNKPHPADKAKSSYPKYNSVLHPNIAALRKAHQTLKGSNKEEYFFKTSEEDLKRALNLYKEYLKWYSYMKQNSDWHEYNMFQNQITEIQNVITDFQTGIQASKAAKTPGATATINPEAKSFMSDKWIKNPPVDTGIEAILLSRLSDKTTNLIGGSKKPKTESK